MLQKHILCRKGNISIESFGNQGNMVQVYTDLLFVSIFLEEIYVKIISPGTGSVTGDGE